MAVGLRWQASGQRITNTTVDPQADRHSDRLLPLIDELLTGCGLSSEDLSALAFDAGPGGFTRVRIACAVTQGIAIGLGVPVAAIDSLQAIALASANETDGIHFAVCSDARMGQCYVGRYHVTPEQMIQEIEGAHTLDTDDVTPWLEKAQLDNKGLYATGSAFERFEALRAAFRGPVHQPGASAVVDAVLTIAQQQGIWQTADQAAPRYVREKVALNVTEQAALRNARQAAKRADSSDS